MQEINTSLQATTRRMADFNKVLSGDDDLGVVIRAHVHIEHELTEFIKNRLHEPSILDKLKPTFEDKVLLAVGLGLQPDYQPALSNIGSLRNTFAHKLNAMLGKQEAKNLRRAMPNEAIEIARTSYSSIRPKLEANVYPERLENLEPKYEVIIYLGCLWSALATASVKATEVK